MQNRDTPKRPSRPDVMATFIATLLLLLLIVLTAVSQSTEPSEPMCYDWGESSAGPVLVLEGEAGWLSCPLFSHPTVYNYTSTQRHNLVWYRLTEGQDLEQPIKFSSRFSKDRERLWLHAAHAKDSGQYICMLRNQSSCSKIGMHLTVVQPAEVAKRTECVVAVETTQVVANQQQGKVLDCPDVQDAAKVADSELNVTWRFMKPNSSKCQENLFWNTRHQLGLRLHIDIMQDYFQGFYFCSVTFMRRGQRLSFTRRLNVTAIYPSVLSRIPTIMNPAEDQIYTVRQDVEVRLRCRGLFPYLNSPWEIWWTIDGTRIDKLPDHHRFSVSNRRKKEDHGDRIEESDLIIQDFQSEDLNRDFTCWVMNESGNNSRRAQLHEEVSLPSLELGCGLGVTLVLMLLLFVVYHVFWLELLLLYRSWFGTDERHTDDKEYDVYISYARNSEEEQFVLSTLRSVLENELGYSVCIFDRDSLPGGTITDETLSFVARSRRLLVVVSPGYASQGSQALLELKAGIDGMALGGHLRVILIQYKPVRRKGWVRELRRARVALALVRWQGDQSKELSSRFWKRLRVELPVRRAHGREDNKGRRKDVDMMRLHSQNSTNNQTGLITNTDKDPQKVLNSDV